ncbi:MAG: hypothetical protein QG659_438 [Patescibacteria group bacterium]|nr:hypothetical protein [Patescibacteria group bacterium]
MFTLLVYSLCQNNKKPPVCFLNRRAGPIINWFHFELAEKSNSDLSTTLKMTGNGILVHSDFGVAAGR